MDYPYIEINAKPEEGGWARVRLQMTSGDLMVSEAHIIAAVIDRLSQVPGVVSIDSTRHYIAETPA
ncbi:hypothetical protein [Streptomyces himalayensis]|uniref:Uncharacterized protein n=1 Tax=Streptomyces himalayensis subsp. himalayensis TaxID=2756131 RepID=A0A7W0DVG2_9ACTN|nr:hypothetical protein [Streptomyces himalayensis]MBA2951987.1 hypothetical protein [Streptomyces himalayensis subsp. himalayensis]